MRAELLEATDEEIEDAVRFADPMTLRGLLYQLTGDPSIAATSVTEVAPPVPATVADKADVDLVRSKAVEFLRGYRDAGAGPIDFGPVARLPRSLALAAGVDHLVEEDVPLWIEELALDPWVRGIRWEQEPMSERLEDFSVVVIGAGMGGLNAAVQLQNAGIPFTVVEKNAGVGGTWFENRYPGARVDTPVRAYTHIFGVDYPLPYPWGPWEENQRYFDWVADTFGVRGRIVFGTEVISVTWDEAAGRWVVIAKGPDGERVWRPNAVVTAVGMLSRPSIPPFEGMRDFAGPSFHTARWPEDLDLSDKRVAVIGTGCSGAQVVPELVRLAGHVVVFQRTPEWLIPQDGYLSPYPPQVGWLDRNLPYYTNFLRFRTNWVTGPDLQSPLREIDPSFDDPDAPGAAFKRVRDNLIAFIETKFASRPELIEKMIPPHPPYAQRPVVVDRSYCYYDALVRDDVTLVTDAIERITPDGIRTVDGSEHLVDVIVFATGFKANEFLWPMEVRGRDGRAVEEFWATDGPRAYIGVMLPGVPNFFMMYGPNTNPYEGLGVVNHEEMAMRYALDCLQHLIMNAKQSIEVTEEAYWRYNSELDEREKGKIYHDPRTKSYYRNEHGRSATNCAFNGAEMWHRLRRLQFDDLITR
jgi:4-hydroxyacetophenone monooxygenase